ncbi:MAG TPA: FAD-dependent oxidoreductase, partial [Chitinophagales bacterium]|nr:FAD-dependent oxidoreductase [Chitinophagales bacterium]
VALAELDALFDGAATANLADSFISEFGKDPFVKGAYSFPAPNTYFTETDTTRIDLGLPVDCKLFFAGEATNNNHPSTVHGALESGARAAAEVLECFTLPIDENVVTDNINMYVFNNNAYFTINTAVIATSVLSLHSIDGKKIQQFYYGRVPAGVNEFQFEISNIANGIYILSADINGKKHQVKVEIIN